MSDTATLGVRGLACARGGVPLLEGLDFAVRAGEALILRGPNGCGKTTLLRTLAGLQPPLAGRIDAPADSIAYAGHADGLKATLTAGENLRFWANIHGGDTIGPALEAMELTPLRDREVRNLSAGQKRRLGLARLLVTGRPIWMLDEPTVSLDTASVALFARAVHAHLAAGGVAVVATHVEVGLDGARSIDLARYHVNPAAVRDVAGFDEAFA